MTERERIAILDDNSMGIGIIASIYRIFLYLTIVGSVISNVAIQRNPVSGPDPSILRFNASPHVIWVVIPLISLVLSDRARLFGILRNWPAMIRNLGFVVIFFVICLLAEIIHWISILIELVSCSSPLCSSSNTYGYLWVLFSFVTIQFILCMWIILRLFMFRINVWGYNYIKMRINNITVDIEQGTLADEDDSSDETSSSRIGKQISIRMADVGEIFETDKKIY